MLEPAVDPLHNGPHILVRGRGRHRGNPRLDGDKRAVGEPRGHSRHRGGGGPPREGLLGDEEDASDKEEVGRTRAVILVGAALRKRSVRVCAVC